MGTIEFSGLIPLNRSDFTIAMARDFLHSYLSEYFKEKHIHAWPGCLEIEGCPDNPLWQCACWFRIWLRLDEGNLFYAVRGDVRPRARFWLWMGLAIFTCGFTFVFAAIDGTLYLISRRYPLRCVENALAALEHRVADHGRDVPRP
jgi:hypothetical protein